MNIRCLGFIPARGGSKRLKNKNILDFDGKPLIHYSIRSAQNSGIFDDIVVSTDSEAIADASQKSGAEVVFRKKELADDFAKTSDVALDLVDELEENGRTYDLLATIQVTNPLREKTLIRNCFNFFQNKPGHNSLVTVSKNHHKFGEIIDNNFIPQNYDPGERSQDLKDLFYENGLFYLTRIDWLKETGKIFGKDALAYQVEGFFGRVDIDEKEDFEIAEFLFKKYKELF